MRLPTALRALPTLFRISFAEALAYRAELAVWILSTTMPLVMLALWSAVAREAPIGRFGQPELVAYFLATFVVRQLTGAWIAWQMNYEVRTGLLSVRLLRPVAPFWGYATDNLAALPLRLVIAVPVALLTLWLVGADRVERDPVIWGLWCVALLGGWLITFLSQVAIGTLALYMESSLKVMDVWLAAFFVFSGYLLPVELFPAGMRAVVDWMPFRYQIGLPVELMTGTHDRTAALSLLARQWLWVGVWLVLVRQLWQGGLRRFSAYGG